MLWTLRLASNSEPLKLVEDNHGFDVPSVFQSQYALYVEYDNDLDVFRVRRQVRSQTDQGSCKIRLPVIYDNEYNIYAVLG